MPRGDGTGPMGMNPMSGRRMGYCAGFAAPGYANFTEFTENFGCRQGFKSIAMGMPRCTQLGNRAVTGTNEVIVNEKEILKTQVKFLETQLQHAKKRLSSFEENAE